ncbi:hypothetical protein GCM10028778_22170 [Barrientosiimonas marina]|uniref:Lipoprotein n=1 Tax=Lentibacillus kimchii TaxID=1542911 RepID=A0ABW2UVT0_9BACI
MKKNVILIFVFIISILLLVSGCSTDNKNDDKKSWTGDFKKAQKIKVISTKDSKVIKSISNEEDIKDFVNSLELDDWELADIPSNSEEGIIFEFYQEDTIKFGDSIKMNDDLNKVATMTAYSDSPYVNFNIKDFSFNFEIPKNICKYLNDYD